MTKKTAKTLQERRAVRKDRKAKHYNTNANQGSVDTYNRWVKTYHHKVADSRELARSTVELMQRRKIQGPGDPQLDEDIKLGIRKTINKSSGAARVATNIAMAKPRILKERAASKIDDWLSLDRARAAMHTMRQEGVVINRQGDIEVLNGPVPIGQSILNYGP